MLPSEGVKRPKTKAKPENEEVSVTPAMPDQLNVTPRLATVLALARREAELHQRREAIESDVVHAILWEGGSHASRVLAPLVDSERLTATLGIPSAESIPTADELLGAAAREAEGLDHSHLGVEHVVLALGRQASSWFGGVCGGSDALSRALQQIRSKSAGA